MEALRDARSDADAGVQQREVARAEAERRAVIASEHRAALNALRYAEGGNPEGVKRKPGHTCMSRDYVATLIPPRSECPKKARTMPPLQFLSVLWHWGLVRNISHGGSNELHQCTHQMQVFRSGPHQAYRTAV